MKSKKQTEATVNLETVIILRHAPANRDGFVTEDGAILVRKMANHLLSRKLANDKTAMLCSNQMRALKTLHCFMNAGVGTDDAFEYDELFSLEERCNVGGALQIITDHAKLSGAKTMLVITHIEMVERLPHAFGERILGVNNFNQHHNVNHCEGVVIDCVKKVCVFVSP